MPPTDADSVVRLVAAARQGDPAAAEALMPLVYDELRRIAARTMRRERPGQTLQPTALVHEAWMRLMGGRALHPHDRAHFLGLAAHTMREILVEHARARRARKRGGGAERVTLHEDAVAGVARPVEIEAIDEALTRLAATSPEQARLVELRFFAGLSIDEVAEATATSPATVKRRWTLAKARLLRELEGGHR